MTPETPKLLNVSEAAERLGVSVSYLNKMRMTPGAGPVFFKIGTVCRYDQADLNVWLDAQKRTSTGAGNPATAGAGQ